jgi:hypothetical protein
LQGAFLFAQHIIWNNNYGGSNMDLPKAIKTTKDGGYIMIGSSNSEDGDTYSESFSSLDIWVVKINNGGVLEWEKRFGGTSSYDFGNDIIQDNKGKYLLLTSSFSKDGQRKAKNNLGNDDIWLVSTDEEGKLLSHRTFGGSLDEFSVKIGPSNEKGGYYVLGNTKSKDKDIKSFSGKQDIWLLKLNKKAKLIWSKCLGTKENDEGYSFVSTKNGGIVVVGETKDHPESNGLYDIWVIHLNSKGEKLWDYVYGGSLDDRGKDIIQLNDGRFIIAGETESNDKVFKDNKGAYDCFLMEISPLGKMEWIKTYGGSSIDYCQKMLYDPSKDEVVMLGGTTSKDGDLKENQGGMDVWLSSYDMKGSLKTSITFGGKYNEDPQDITIDKKGNYLILSGTNSNDGDIISKNSYNKNDYWLLKVNPEISANKQNTGTLGNCIVKTYSAGFIVAGKEVLSNNKSDIFLQEYDDSGFEGFKKRLKGNENDIAYKILKSNDGTGSYYLTGTSNSDKGKFDKNKGKYDCLFTKLNGSGEAMFNYNFGGSNDDIGYDLKRFDKNSFIIAGASRSEDQDIKNIHYGDNDIWVLKINKIGQIEWERSIGGTKEDVAKSTIINKKKQIISVGYSQSNNNDIKRSYGNMDGIMVILSDTGKLITVRNFGGNGNDWFNDVCLTKDGGYLFVGGTKSITNEETRNTGSQTWIVKANSYGVIDWEKTYGGTGNDEAISVIAINRNEFIVAANSNSSYNKKSPIRNQYISVLKINENGKIIDQKDIKQVNNVYCADIISISPNVYTVGGYEEDEEKQTSIWSYEFRF